MWKFIAKRLVSMIPVLLGVTLIIYLIMSMAPGDPAKVILGEQATPEQIAELREEMGLNDPVLVQYGRYISGLVRGDMGESYNSGLPCQVEIFARFPNTLRLAAVAVTISVILALPLGVLAAVKQNTLFDGISMVIALIGISMPVFWLGLLLIMFFALRLGWFPTGGNDQWNSIVLPAVTVGVGLAALMTRTTRSSMLDVLRQDYLRTARAKGVTERKVLRKHALRNALIPIITIFGVQFSNVLGGSVLAETVFAWPGVGRLVVDAIDQRDIPTVTGALVMTTMLVTVVNLLVDIVYAYVDPRIKAQYTK